MVPYDASRHVLLSGMHHAQPPLCEHPLLRVACTHCRQVVSVGTVYYEATLPQPYVAWCARCLALGE